MPDPQEPVQSPYLGGQASDDYFRQLAQFNASRDSFYQALMNGINQHAAPEQVTQTPTPAMQQAAQTPPTDQWSDPDLLAAAQYWGVPKEVAQHMPRDVLVKQIDSYRANARPDESTFAHRAGAAADMLMSVPEMFGIGAGEALTGLAQHLPLVGPRLAALKGVQEADTYLRELEESVRSSTPENFQPVLSGVNVAGNLAAMWFPGAGAWKIAGKPIGWVASPLVRAAAGEGGAALAARVTTGALQGAGSGYLLEGGGPSPAGAVAGGAVLGAAGSALEPYIAAAANKISKQFLSPEIMQNVQGPSGAPLAEAHPYQSGLSPSYDAVLDEYGLNRARRTPEDFARGAGPSNIETAGRLGITRLLHDGGAIFPGMNAETAEVAAIQMNKVNAIVDSPIMPTIAKQTAPDDFSVAQALGASNPGGTNVIDGIGDPSSLVRWNEVGHVGFAQRKGRLAVITSDLPVTPEMIDSFEKHGVYPGQDVLTGGGLPATIVSIADDGTATLNSPYSSMQFNRHVSELSPATSSAGIHAVPDMWNHFQAFADAQAIRAQAAMGGVLRPDQIAAIRQQNVPHYMEEFLDQAGIGGEGDRARIKNYFNQQWVESFKTVAPEEALGNEVARASAETETNVNPPTPVARLDQMADSKGFIAIPDGEGGWRLRNAAPGVSGATAPVEMSFSDLDAAQKHLQTLNRSQQDITPPTSVPIELAGELMRESIQPPNLNARQVPAIVRSINDMAEETGGVPPVPPEEVAQAADEGDWSKLTNLWKKAAAFTPMRQRFASISQAVRGILGDDMGLAQHFDQLDTLHIRNQNNMQAPTNALGDIFSYRGIGVTKRLINGEWMQTWQIGDDAMRAAKADALGWTDGEKKSLDDFSQWLSNVAGQDVSPELRKYVAQIAQNQSIPELQQSAWDNFAHTSDVTQAWKDFASTSGLNLREMDPRVFGESIMRSVNWQKTMAGPFNEIAEHWSGIAHNMPNAAPVAGFMKNWMDIMKQGYTAHDDAALDAIHYVAQGLMGPSFTHQQTKELINFGMNTTHSAFLGYRVHVMARDFVQFAFALPRAGTDLLSVIGKYTTDAAYRQKVLANALGNDAIQLIMPQRVAPGSLGGELEQASAGLAPETMSPQMRMTGAVTAAVRDIVPHQISDIAFKGPMYLYGRQKEIMRAMVYQAGVERAERALGTYRANGRNGLFDMEQLMGDSSARTYDPAWQEEFKRLVATGDDQRAASFLGRQLADVTQFKYGISNSPTIGRTTTGKLAMQFGSFQNQFLQYIRESMVNGTVADKAKFLLTAGAVSGMARGAAAATGWNFNYLNPYQLGWAGGPGASVGMGLAQGAGAVATAFTDPDKSGIDKALSTGGAAVGSLASALNPVSGLYNTVSGVVSALNDSPMPGHALARLVITGERGALPDIVQSVHSADLQPMSSPVRQGGYQLPGVPHMQAVYPFGVTLGQPATGIQHPSEVRGGASSYSGNRPQASEDSSFIPFTAHPQPGMAAGYNTSDVQAVLAGLNDPRPGGQSPAARFFAPDELKFLTSLRGVPSQQAVELFRGYMRDKVQHSANGTPQDSSYNQPFPGGGAFS